MIAAIEPIVWQATVSLEEVATSFSSDIKVQKVALAALSGLSAVLSGTILSLVVSAQLPSFFSLAVFPLGVLMFLAGQTALNLKNYEDPLELLQMKQNAKYMTFAQLLKEHRSIEKVISYGIVDRIELKCKFLMSTEGKFLSQIMEEVSVPYLLKSGILTKEEVRKMLYKELPIRSDIYDLYAHFQEMGMSDLKEMGVFSSEEYRSFQELFIKEEEVELLERKNFFAAHSLFFGRRGLLLEDLERKEKRARDSLQMAYSQDKKTSPEMIRALRRDLTAIQEEKARVKLDETLGAEAQRLYDDVRQNDLREYQVKKEKLKQEFRAICHSSSSIS